jgi:hypothetical protein
MTERPRIIVALPDPAESGAVADVLSADGFEPVRHSTPRAVLDEMRARRFDLLIVDTGFPIGGVLRVAGPKVSTLTPIVLVGPPDAAAPRTVANPRSMFVPRPIDRAMLSCFVSMAMLDGRPARRSERKPIDRFDAVANGIAAVIVDVSLEGMRLEVAHTRHVLPPCFTVRVPLVGIGVTVQRMWTQASGARTGILCGGALSQNRAALEQAWRSFVSTLPARGERAIQLSC